MPRLFAALEIAHQAHQSLSLLRAGLPNAHWVEPADYHITLRFYGDVHYETADEIEHLLSQIAFDPFAIELKGVHVFTPKKPHSLYAEVVPNKALLALQQKIEHYSRRVVAADKRNFIPHVTLARIKHVKESDLIKYLSSRANFAAPEFEVKRFHLMSSKDSVGGGPYVIENSWSLTGD